MSKITNFLVGLGYDVDQASYNRAMGNVRSFGRGITEMSRKVTASVAGLSGVLGAKLATVDYARTTAELTRLSQKIGVTVNDIKALGTASEKQGGGLGIIQAQLQALESIRNLRPDELASIFRDFGITGLDPQVILDADNASDAYLRLIGVIDDLDKKQQVQMTAALGFDDSFLRLAQQGRQELEGVIKLEKERRSLNAGAGADALEFEDQVINLKNNLGTIVDAFSQTVIPGINKNLETLNTNLVEFRDEASETAKNFGEVIGEYSGAIAAAIAALGAAAIAKKFKIVNDAITVLGGIAKKTRKPPKGGKPEAPSSKPESPGSKPEAPSAQPDPPASKGGKRGKFALAAGGAALSPDVFSLLSGQSDLDASSLLTAENMDSLFRLVGEGLGAAGGGALGSFVSPVVGTGIGGAAGYVAGGEAGERLSKLTRELTLEAYDSAADAVAEGIVRFDAFTVDQQSRMAELERLRMTPSSSLPSGFDALSRQNSNGSKSDMVTRGIMNSFLSQSGSLKTTDQPIRPPSSLNNFEQLRFMMPLNAPRQSSVMEQGGFTQRQSGAESGASSVQVNVSIDGRAVEAAVETRLLKARTITESSMSSSLKA